MNNTQHKAPQKTMGRQTARLLTGLYDLSKETFTLSDAQSITGLKPDLASSLLKKAVQRGLVSRLKRGLFIIVPQTLGSAAEYAGNPYIVARELTNGAEYFLSHASAMEIHRMVTQPQLVVFTSCVKRIATRTISGTEYRFVLTKPANYFGYGKHWATKQEVVLVSGLERTVLDGLRQPEYCGGVTDVAKGLWMRHADIEHDRLIGLAKRMGVGAVLRRLGFLLELYGLAPQSLLESLRSGLTSTYVALDPTLPREGPHLDRWRLQLNIAPNELERVRST